jgi:hypothetical protein
MPSERITLSSPPASPVRLTGAAAMIALLLGEMNNPCPMPKIANASITGKRLPWVPSITMNSKANPITQISMPDAVSKRPPSRS